jgi:hypothetical protein
LAIQIYSAYIPYVRSDITYITLQVDGGGTRDMLVALLQFNLASCRGKMCLNVKYQHV